MTKLDFNKTCLDSILTELNYFENFKNKYLNRKYERINYGKRIGELSFDGFFDAAKKYTYSNQISEDIFNSWNIILNKNESTEEDLFCTVLEIFVWGDVLNGNVKKSIELYKNKKLRIYISHAITLLKEEKIIIIPKTNKKDIELIWSSGWTKVYSFIDNKILIYDSSVAKT